MYIDFKPYGIYITQFKCYAELRTGDIISYSEYIGLKALNGTLIKCINNNYYYY